MNSDHSPKDLLGLRVLDHISAMISYWDKDQICRFDNAAYLTCFNKTKEEMIDKMSIAELLGPLYEKNLPHINRALKGENQLFEREIPFHLGGIRHTLANYYPDIIDGEVAGFFVHVADVNDLKVLELKFEKSNKIVTEQKNRLLNYSNIVSHNLKSYANNLTSILDILNVAESETEKKEMIHLLNVISKQFNATVNDLNEVSKTQNQAGINSELINLYEYIEKSRDILQIQISNSKASIINNVSTLIHLFTNPSYMESIFLNLISNAIKYRREEIDPIITLDCIQKNGMTTLIIKDNGKGINLEKHRKHLFGMNKTFHGNPDAQGIGLYITKYQIETMGGEIKVDSTVGIGTTFTIQFNLL